MSKYVLYLTFECRNCKTVFGMETGSNLEPGAYMAHVAMNLPIEFMEQTMMEPVPVHGLMHYPHNCNGTGVIGMGDLIRAVESK